MTATVADWLHRTILYLGDAARLKATAELLTAVAALLWPVAFFLVLFVYRGDVRRVFQRLRKARLLGQELELDEELSAVQRSVDAAVEAVESEDPHPPPSARTASGNLASAGSPDVLDEVSEILRIAAQSPKAALMLLASHIERRLRGLVQAPGESARIPTVVAMVQRLAKDGRIPESLANSISSFLHVRSRVLHGGEATPNEVLRAIDVGLTLLRTLSTVPPDL
jgi:hypothetical protein